MVDRRRDWMLIHPATHLHWQPSPKLHLDCHKCAVSAFFSPIFRSWLQSTNTIDLMNLTHQGSDIRLETTFKHMVQVLFSIFWLPRGRDHDETIDSLQYFDKTVDCSQTCLFWSKMPFFMKFVISSHVGTLKAIRPLPAVETPPEAKVSSRTPLYDSKHGFKRGF